MIVPDAGSKVPAAKTISKACRKAFHKWMKYSWPQHSLERSLGGGYRSAGTQHKWLGFKESYRSNELREHAILSELDRMVTAFYAAVFAHAEIGS